MPKPIPGGHRDVTATGNVTAAAIVDRISQSHCSAAFRDRRTTFLDRLERRVSTDSVDGLRACLDPAFEMIVPRQPARGFRGRDQEIATLSTLFETHPGFAVEIHRTAVNGNEVWTETAATAAAAEMEMAAVVIWAVDPAGTTISSGRYYSEAVRREGPGITGFIRGLGQPS